MNPNQRNNYLKALQIDTWVPRTKLPYAAPSAIKIANNTLPINVQPIEVENLSQNSIFSQQDLKEIVVNKEKQRPIPSSPIIKNETEQYLITDDRSPSFSLQLMKAGSCLLLLDLPQGKALQIDDKRYQLLRNILRAAKLPDSPEWLGDVIHWPLFKQTSIPQGRYEAKEFLQSFIKTYQEQIVDIKYLWLIGDAAITYTIHQEAPDYYQLLSDHTLGKLLTIPALDNLLNNPDQKAKLWQTLKPLIPTWKK